MPRIRQQRQRMRPKPKKRFRRHKRPGQPQRQPQSPPARRPMCVSSHKVIIPHERAAAYERAAEGIRHAGRKLRRRGNRRGDFGLPLRLGTARHERALKQQVEHVT